MSMARLGRTVLLVGTLAACAGAPLAHDNGYAQQARAEIERLHQDDVEATLSDKADKLAKLWDGKAVRIEPGHPVEIGRRSVE